MKIFELEERCEQLKFTDDSLRTISFIDEEEHSGPKTILARVVQHIDEDKRLEALEYLKELGVIRYKYEIALTRFLVTPLYKLIHDQYA